ncbi:MAG: energy-coupling factor ABC transporter permease [Desulfuromonadales bacterium]|nr:energy-coupling factor ABC transporter permease [Desulfuromonadales bacterium]
MHMADALISPAVGAAFWAASAAGIAACSAKLRRELDDHKIPLMGVMGAFIFAAQMINFAIPATGSSGHIGGGLLLAVLLGPWAAFLTLASVLMVQALFFADGGLLALGCNIFNLGFFPAFIAYPLIYKPLASKQPGQARLIFASIAAAVVGLQIGSFFVVTQTTLSGVAELPFSTFLLMMQPIHLAIGVIEGIVTALVLSFVYKARPELLTASSAPQATAPMPKRTLLAIFLVASLMLGGLLSWFAAENPDGLEWAVAHVSGHEELENPEAQEHATAAAVQEKTALLPDYALPATEGVADDAQRQRVGTSLSGIVGGLVTLAFCLVIGLVLKKRGGKREQA